MLKGYIFDMDGTLIDSMRMIMELDVSIFKRLSLPVSEEALLAMKYIPLADSASLLKKMFSLEQSEDELCRIMYDAMRSGYATVEPKEHALDFVRRAHDAGLRLCIATATEPEIALEVAERLGFMRYMDFLVSCSEVGASKEKPDVFLEASRRFGLAPHELAVFEDGLPGATSAHGAGFKTVGVYDEPSSSPESSAALRDICDIYISSFAELEHSSFELMSFKGKDKQS